jgi:quercetin dioxygenase-like cupin family protein
MKRGPAGLVAPGELASSTEATAASSPTAWLMMFEEVAPVGTVTPMHLHHDSDEVAYVVSGEITFKIGDAVSIGGPGTCAFMPRDVAHAWKSTGAEAGRVVFLYTPGRAGKLFEEMTERPLDPMNLPEFGPVAERYGWEFVGPPPF